MGASDSIRRTVRRGRPSITQLFDEGHAIDEALRLGVHDALVRHKLLGQQVATWRDGRVLVLEPAEIPVDGSTESERPGRARRRSSSRRR